MRGRAHTQFNDFDKELAYLLTQGVSETDAADKYLDRTRVDAKPYLDKNGTQFDASKLSRRKSELESLGLFETILNEIYVEPTERAKFAEKFHHEHYLDLEEGLQELPSSRLRSVWVVRSGARDDPQKEPWRRTFGWFSRNASSYITRLLASTNMLGVAWGRTTGAVIDAIGTVTAAGAVSSKPHLQVFPTAGRPIFRTLVPEGSDSTALARCLAARLNSEQPVVSLDEIPWTLNVPYAESTLELERARHQSHPNFVTVFGSPRGDPNALLSRADAILTSAGSLSHNKRVWNTELRYRGLSWVDIERDCVGDIGGALIPRNSLKFADQGWMGISLCDFERIAAHANPGVILIIFGSNKAEVALRAVQLGLVSHLVTDETLAVRLRRYMPNRKWQR
jgi:DNA-binding transcriptional regulator LsrR (DeoR family)